jgi:hypothetical protein
VTATCAIERSLTRRIKEAGHKLYMDNLFSSPDIFDDLYTVDINYCGTVRQNCKQMSRGLDKKILKLKWGDIHAGVRCYMTAVILKDK